jgi:hypothetical protein|tara:strand:- start:350 stop:958 length:609 start_codon:yes stop_codon:yes gene_type:complete
MEQCHYSKVSEASLFPAPLLRLLSTGDPTVRSETSRMLLLQSTVLLLLTLTSALRVPFLNQPVQAPAKLSFGQWSHSVKELDGVVVPVNRAVAVRPRSSVSTTCIDPQDTPVGWASVMGDAYSPQNIVVGRGEKELLNRVGLVSATLLVVTAWALANLILGGAGVSAAQATAQSLLKRVARLGAVLVVPKAQPMYAWVRYSL